MSVPCAAMIVFSVDRRGTRRSAASGAAAMWSCALKKRDGSAGSVAGTADQNHAAVSAPEGAVGVCLRYGLVRGRADPGQCATGRRGIQFMLFGCDLDGDARTGVAGRWHGRPGGYRFPPWVPPPPAPLRQGGSTAPKRLRRSAPRHVA